MCHVAVCRHKFWAPCWQHNQIPRPTCRLCLNRYTNGAPSTAKCRRGRGWKGNCLGTRLHRADSLFRQSLLLTASQNRTCPKSDSKYAWPLTRLVSWCFEPSQPQRITSGLNTNFTLSPSRSFYKSTYHKSCLFSLFIFRGHSEREPASSRVTYFILRAYTAPDVSHSQHRKKSGEVLEKMQVNGPEG